MRYERNLFLTTLLVSTLVAGGCGSTDQGPLIATIEVTPSSGTISPGETLQLTATAKDSLNAVLAVTLVWSSNDNLVAAVTGNGLVTAVAEGSASITASADGRNGEAAIFDKLVVTVDVSPANSSVRTGASTQLTATPRDGSGDALMGLTATWSSGSPGVATVDANGLVTGVAHGTATITSDVDGTTGVANVASWVGVTGSWAGSFDWPTAANPGSCGFTVSLTEDALAGTFTGTGNLSGPACVTVPITFNGTNVADVITAEMSSNGLPNVPFNGNFDGLSSITGAFSGSIVSTNFVVGRSSFTPTPQSVSAQEGSSGAYSTWASAGN